MSAAEQPSEGITSEEAQRIADSFDAYFDELGLSVVDAPVAFAAWMHNETGWDGDSKEIQP